MRYVLKSWPACSPSSKEMKFILLFTLKKLAKTIRIWKETESAISILRTLEEAFVQMGLFGLVDDLDLAVKVGFSLGDRIVLVDYLYERILSKLSPERINITHIGSIASSLVNLLPLAEKGRIVMIPNPFMWHSDSKQIISEVIRNGADMTPELLSLLNIGKSSVSCPLKPSDSAPLKHSTMPP